jgi:hypothetical protein
MSPGGWNNEHITAVKWLSDQDGAVGESSREGMVDWIANRGGVAYELGVDSRAEVGVVNASPSYLRTHANGIWNDNLLSLSTF